MKFQRFVIKARAKQDLKSREHRDICIRLANGKFPVKERIAKKLKSKSVLDARIDVLKRSSIGTPVNVAIAIQIIENRVPKLQFILDVLDILSLG